MKSPFTRRRIAAVAALLTAAAVFGVAGLKLEGTVPHVWGCESVEDVPYRDEIIQIGDTMFIGEEYETLRIYTSYNGLTWSEIESPASDHDIWSCSIALFRTSDDRLGIAWEETSPTDEKPRSIFYWSIFDNNTWSEPETLLSRDVYSFLNDAIMLEDGALLLLWEEPLFQYIEHEGKTVRYSGCEVVYRAYVGNDQLLIDRVIEPEDPFSCSIGGISFVDDGERIWCVFRELEDDFFFYRSWSEDGRQWSPPELMDVPGSHLNQILLTPQGEIGITKLEMDKKDYILRRSSDWENWSEETVFEAEKGSIRYAKITDGSNGTMWGFITTGNDTFFVYSSQDLTENQEAVRVARMLEYLALSCIALTILYVLSWMRGHS